MGLGALRCRTSQVSSFRVQLSGSRVINCAASSVVRHLTGQYQYAHRQRSGLRLPRSLSLPSFLRQGYALNLEFTDSVKLAGQIASGISLFPPLRCWDYKCALLCLVNKQKTRITNTHVLEIKLKALFLYGRYLTLPFPQPRRDIFLWE